jgi:hypothetical protein
VGAKVEGATTTIERRTAAIGADQESVAGLKKSHLAWVTRVDSIVAGREKLAERQVPSHTECTLGTWYESVGRRDYGDVPQFRSIEQPHAAFHRAIKEAVSAHNRADSAGARTGAAEVRRISADVVSALDAFDRCIDTNGCRTRSGQLVPRRRSSDWQAGDQAGKGKTRAA